MARFHATNEPGSCLWCGQPLRDDGYAGDGFFCTLRCGYAFGRGMANLGKRFEPKANAPPPPARNIYVNPKSPCCRVQMAEAGAWTQDQLACPACGAWYPYDTEKRVHVSTSGQQITTHKRTIAATAAERGE